MVPRNDEQAFWKRVDRLDSDACWNWRGASTPKKYGTFSYDGRIWAPHRLAYTFAVGPIPDGLIVRHRCGNSRCCNPRHLVAGTYKENSADRTEHGRTVMGEQHHNAKLTADDVREMRRLYGDGWNGTTQVALAERYGITQAHVGRILRRVPAGGWAHIE